MPIPSFTLKVDGVDDVLASHINAVQNEITKMAYGVPVSDYGALKSISTDTTLTDADAPIVGISATTSGLIVILPNVTANSHAYFLRNCGVNAWSLRDNTLSVVDVVQPGDGVLCWPTSDGLWACTSPRLAILDDTLSPSSSSAKIIDLLGMLGNIVKTQSGVESWVNAGKPLNVIRYAFSAGGATVAAGTTVFISPGSGLLSSGGASRMPIDVSQTFTRIFVRIATTQPSTGSLSFTLQVGGIDTALALTVAAGAGSGTYSVVGSAAASYPNTWNLKIVNSATAASAQIAGILVTASV